MISLKQRGTQGSFEKLQKKLGLYYIGSECLFMDVYQTYFGCDSFSSTSGRIAGIMSLGNI